MPKVAKVILPIALDKEFDYSIPNNFKIEPGSRVLVDFNRRKLTGLVAGLANDSSFKKLKSILTVLDSSPSLSREQMQFAKLLSNHYPYSWGEFLFMFLPSYLKKARKYDFKNYTESGNKINFVKPRFFKADKFLQRYQLWKSQVQKELENGSVIICFPQLSYLLEAKQVLEKDFANIKVIHSQEKEKDLCLNWETSRHKALILGTRMALFHYPADLRLIIVEQENNPYYFQEEKPFYHLLDVALLLSKTKGVNLNLSDDLPSLNAYKLIKDGEIDLIDKGVLRKDIKVVDTTNFNKKKLISPVLSAVLQKVIRDNKKAVILWNRKGFARVISCSNCGQVVTCQHCSSFLRSSINADEVMCPYCNRKSKLPNVCSKCSGGYLKGSGFGIERIGSLLKKIFPEARIDDWENRSDKTQIILSTSKMVSYLYGHEHFDLGCVLDVDHSLAQAKYDATFNLFVYLKKLMLFFNKTLYVFTCNSKYYLFKYLNCNWREFYEFELQCRKDFNVPPFGLIANITLRSKNEITLLKHAQDLYNRLEGKFTQVYGPFPEQPFKLRDKYRYTLVVKAKRNLRSRQLIKEEVNSLRTSSIKVAAVLR